MALGLPEPEMAGRLAALLHLVCGAYVVVVSLLLPVAPTAHRGVLVGVGVAAAAIGLLQLHLPWNRWPAWSTALIGPEALILIAVHSWALSGSGYHIDPFTFVLFAWIGLTQRRGTALIISPLLALATLLPALIGTSDVGLALTGAAMLVPVCVLTAETVAWTTAEQRQLRGSLAASEELVRASFDDAAVGACLVEPDGRVARVNRTFASLVGEPSQELIGRPARSVLGAGADVAATLIDLADPDVSTGATDSPASPRWAEIELTDAAGGHRWAELAAAPTAAGPEGGYVVQLRDVTDRRAREARLSHAAHHDALTGLPNRVALVARLARLAASPTSTPGRGPAVLFVDLDDFKGVNDRLGHAAGDAVLTIVAERLSAAVRPGDLVARYGGDEFVIVCDDVSRTDTEGLLGRLQAAVGAPMQLGQHRSPEAEGLQVGASIGVVTEVAPGTSPEAVLRLADRRMYEVKLGRRGCGATSGL